MIRRAAALLCFLLAGCAPPATREIVLADWGIELQIPAAWQVQARTGGAPFFARPTLPGGTPLPGAHFTLVRDEPRAAEAPPSLSSYVDFRERGAAQHRLDYRLLERVTLSLAGIAAVRHVREYRTRTQAFQALAVMAVREGRGHELVGVAYAQDFPRLRDDYRRVVSSVRWMAEAVPQ